MEYYNILKEFKINNIIISSGMNKYKHRLNNLEYKLSNLLNYIYKEHAHGIIKTSNNLNKLIKKKENNKLTTLHNQLRCAIDQEHLAKEFTYKEYLNLKNLIYKQRQEDAKREKGASLAPLQESVKKNNFFKNNKLLPYSDFNLVKYFSIFF